jgi:hypothetical protein
MLMAKEKAWYKLMLASFEVTWLTAVVSDISMIFTQEYASYYSAPNIALVWLITNILSWVKPVQYRAEVQLQCQVVEVDYELVCHSGRIVIGELQRLLSLAGNVIACAFFSYIFTRYRLSAKPTRKVHSGLLYSAAKYLFNTSNWIYDDIYHLDRASAVLNGMLTVRWQNQFYVFDIKIWRAFVIEIHSESPQDYPVAFSYALPLTD